MKRAARTASQRASLLSGLAAALLAGPIAAPQLARASGDHDYVGAAKCRTCHKKELIGNQYAAWRAGPHQRAHQTLSSEASLAIAQARAMTTAPVDSAACLRCHVTAYGVPETRIAHPLARAAGVQCESCHGPGRDYRKKKIMSDVELATRKGLWDAGGNSAICTACHNEESPTHDPARYRLPDGSTSGFDFELAKARIRHDIPEHVKGHYIELEKEQKLREKQKLKEEQKQLSH